MKISIGDLHQKLSVEFNFSLYLLGITSTLHAQFKLCQFSQKWLIQKLVHHIQYRPH